MTIETLESDAGLMTFDELAAAAKASAEVLHLAKKRPITQANRESTALLSARRSVAEKDALLAHKDVQLVELTNQIRKLSCELRIEKGLREGDRMKYEKLEALSENLKSRLVEADRKVLHAIQRKGSVPHGN